MASTMDNETESVATGPAAPDPAIAAFLRDYIELYCEKDLRQWRELFLPGAVVTGVNDDGSVTMWNRDEFYGRQRAAFATGKPIHEHLDDPRVERTGSLACVRSEFVWTDGSLTRRGKLMLLLVEEHRQFKAQSLTFTYAG